MITYRRQKELGDNRPNTCGPAKITPVFDNYSHYNSYAVNKIFDNALLWGQLMPTDLYYARLKKKSVCDLFQNGRFFKHGILKNLQGTIKSEKLQCLGHRQEKRNER